MSLATVGINVKVGGIAQANAQFKALQYAINDVAAAASKMKKNVQLPTTVNIAKAYGEGSTAVADFSKNIDQSSRSNVKFTVGQQQAAAQLTKTQKALKAVSAGIVKFGSAVTGPWLKNMGASITSFGRQLQSFGASLTMLGSRMTTFISLPIVGVIGKSVVAAATFEDQMVSLRTQVKLSAEDVERFQEGLLEMIPAVGKTATELGAAGYGILSRDIRDVDLALKVLEGSAKASAVGLGETEEIAKLVTAVMVTYGATNMSAGNAVEFLNGTLDYLVAGIQFGSLEADEMVEPLGRVLGMANDLGVSFAELTAFTGTYGATGQSASEATTALGRVLASFVKPSGKAEAALEAIDYDVAKLRVKLGEEGLAGTLQFLAKEFKDAGVPMSDFIGRLPGLNAALFLTADASQLYLETLENIENSAGNLEEAFDITKMKTTFMWDQIRASAEAVGISIGQVLLPEVNKLMQAFMPLLMDFSKFVKLNPELIKMFTVIGLGLAVIGPLVIAMGLVAASIGAVISVIGGLISAFAFMLTPIGLVVAALGTAAAALTGTFLISARETADKAGMHFDNMADRAQTWGSNVITSFAQGMADAISDVVQVLINIGGIITEWLQGHSPPKLLPDLEMWGTNVMDVFLGGMTLADFKVFDEISGIFEKAMKAMSPKDSTDLLPAISEMREKLAEGLAGGGLTPALMDEMTSMFGALGTNTKMYVETLIELAAAQADVKAAQEEITRVTREYEEAIKPLDAELDSFARIGQALNDAQRKAVLNRRLNDPRTSAMEKELILMELRTIEINKQKKELEDERDVALTAANENLTAAQIEEARLTDQAALYKKVIDAQIDHRDLMKEQVDLLNRLADAAERVDKALSGGGGYSPPGDDTFDKRDMMDGLLDVVPGGAGGPGSKMGAKDALLGPGGLLGQLGDAVADIQLIFAPLMGEDGLFAELSRVWSDIFTNEDMRQKIDDALEFAGSALKLYIGVKLVTGVLGGFEKAWAGLNVVLGAWKLLAGTSVITAIAGALITAVSSAAFIAAAPVIAAIAVAVGLLVTAIHSAGGISEAWDILTGIFSQIGTIFKAIKDDWVSDGDSIDTEIGRQQTGLLNHQNTAYATRQAIEDDAVSAIEATGATASSQANLDALTTQLSTFDEESGKTWVEILNGQDIELQKSGVIMETTMVKNLGLITATLPGWQGDMLSGGEKGGTDFGDGLNKGIVDSTDKVVESVTNLAQAAQDAWNEHYDNHSPSKVAQQDAEFVMKGYMLGFEGLSGKLNETIARNVVGARAAANNSFAQTQHKVYAPENSSRAGGRNISIGPNYINNDMDMAVFEARVRRTVRETI